ncbi:MAG: chemotaxis protein CheW [Pseudomonadota bacterium]
MSSNVAEEYLRCMYVPTVGGGLVLPIDMVAEVVAYSEPTAGMANDWYLGDIPWRGQALPLVSVELAALGERPDIGVKARIAVLQGLANFDRLPFWGVVTESAPTMVLVSDSTARWRNNSAKLPPFVLAEVDVGERAAWIPNFDELEEHLERMLL